MFCILGFYFYFLLACLTWLGGGSCTDLSGMVQRLQCSNQAQMAWVKYDGTTSLSAHDIYRRGCVHAFSTPDWSSAGAAWSGSGTPHAYYTFPYRVCTPECVGVIEQCYRRVTRIVWHDRKSHERPLVALALFTPFFIFFSIFSEQQQVNFYKSRTSFYECYSIPYSILI